MNYTRAMIDPESRPEGIPLRFVLSTPGTKRDGIDLENDRIRVENFRRNPVMPWQHGFDPVRGSVPIGRWSDVRLRSDNTLVGDAVFDDEDEFAQGIESKYRRGFLNAVSISWITERDESRNARDAYFHDLLEVSAVTVPADPDALQEGRAVMLTSAELDRMTNRIERLERELVRQRKVAAAARAFRNV